MLPLQTSPDILVLSQKSIKQEDCWNSTKIPLF